MYITGFSLHTQCRGFQTELTQENRKMEFNNRTFTEFGTESVQVYYVSLQMNQSREIFSGIP